MTDQPKFFAALLNSLLRKLYGDESSRGTITPEVLHEQVFRGTDATLEDVTTLFTLCERIIGRASLELWDVTTFEEMIAKTALSPVQQDVMAKFWRVKRPLIQDVLSRRSDWTNHLESFAWRIDVHARSKAATSLEETTTLIEFTIAPGPAGSSGSSESEIVRFQMDRMQLAQTRHELTNIQAHLRTLASHE